jgi:hypothetical protein
MTPLFTKLNLGSHRDILVLNAPDNFATELATLKGVAVRRDLGATPTVAFALIFVQTLAEVRATAADLLPRAPGDAVVWFAYPKGTSRRYQYEFNRDTGWAAVTDAGFEPVRQVAIDEDWSALRFRRVEYVKKRTGDISRASPNPGKAKSRKKRS